MVWPWFSGGWFHLSFGVVFNRLIITIGRVEKLVPLNSQSDRNADLDNKMLDIVVNLSHPTG